MGRTSLVAIVTRKGLPHLVSESQECAGSFSVERLLHKIRLNPKDGSCRGQREFLNGKKGLSTGKWRPFSEMLRP